MSGTRFLLMGPAESGKTSYLAAFWIHANGAAPAGLGVKSHPKDTSYLEELQKAWLNFTRVPRTSGGMDRSVDLEVVRQSDRAAFALVIPDLSGETFDQIWTHRHWTLQFQTLLNGCAGALLFIHPQKIQDGPTLEAVQDLRAQLPPEPAVPHAEAASLEPAKEKPIAAPFDIAKVPTQIQLIDSLQLMTEAAELRRPFRLGVVISAWDTVLANEARAQPETWLKRQMPGLLSYLGNNTALFDFKIFGVSAQGIDYEKLTADYENTPPEERCRVVGEGVTNTKDVTIPLRWLMGE